ncbi:15159_t:CDS:2 [Rhizophagus irregularis]|nr:15159_t:CDS:2 [Rhizophagus irregularis]
MEMLLKRILTPKTSVDLLRDIAQAQLDSCLYTTCFIGVKLNVRNQVMGYDDNPRTIQSTTKDYIWEIPIKDFLAASDELFDARVGVGVVNYPPFMSMKFKSYRIIQQNVELEIYGRITADDSGWKMLPVIMTDELNQARLPLFAGILDISECLLFYGSQIYQKLVLFQNGLNGLKILIAACDTGAIEQLSVYVALGKNSMLTWIWKRCWVSKGLLRWRHLLLAYILHFWPKQTKAGRMQNNEPITDNASVSEMNKIVFVGEALVGNEAVDQLTKFN